MTDRIVARKESKGALSSGQLSRNTSNPLRGSNSSKKGATGVYGANPSPAFSDYKQSIGKDTIPLKFAETGIPTKRDTNPMRRNVETTARAQAKEAKSSTIKTGKNRYRSSVGKGKR